jgi:L-amino acid N-acyltransferase YncA
LATIRPAVALDAETVAAIYNEGIEERSSTFEPEPRSAADIHAWLAAGERRPR